MNFLLNIIIFRLVNNSPVCDFNVSYLLVALTARRCVGLVKIGLLPHSTQLNAAINVHKVVLVLQRSSLLFIHSGYPLLK